MEWDGVALRGRPRRLLQEEQRGILSHGRHVPTHTKVVIHPKHVKINNLLSPLSMKLLHSASVADGVLRLRE